ncbi:3-hydroxyacyl-CoA dehydrogenase family protein, partial [Chromobacterium haemolyticum]
RLQAGGVRLEREPGPAQGWLSWDGLRLALSDGRSATRRAADSGHAGWAVFDLALDYASAQRLALAVADQAAPELAAQAEGVLQAAGLQVSRLDDAAGMAVLRTVAMLANEAADAVGQGVAAADSVDQAMCLGAAYPRGPLAWADRLGNEYVAQVLDALHAQYGDERYRVSPLLRRLALSGGRFHD